MEITKEDFLAAKSISIDISFVQPKIRMCRDMGNKQLIHVFECNNEEAANELFRQLLNAWKEVRDGAEKLSTTDT